MFEMLTWEPTTEGMPQLLPASNTTPARGCETVVAVEDKHEVSFAASRHAEPQPAVYDPRAYATHSVAAASAPSNRNLPKLPNRWSTENQAAYTRYMDPAIVFPSGASSWDHVGKDFPDASGMDAKLTAVEAEDAVSLVHAQAVDPAAAQLVATEQASGEAASVGPAVFDMGAGEEGGDGGPQPAGAGATKEDRPGGGASAPKAEIAARAKHAAPRSSKVAGGTSSSRSSTAPASSLPSPHAMAASAAGAVTSTTTRRKTTSAQRRASRKQAAARFSVTKEELEARERRAELERLRRDSRFYSDSKFARVFAKPPFGMYGSGNRSPVDGGVFDGGYMASHNVMPLMHPANPKTEIAMEIVRFTNQAAILKFDPARYADMSGVRPGEEGEAKGPDDERLMVTARMALEDQYGAAVAERMAKRAEERARAARMKEEQAKPPPAEVDDSKRKVSRRAGAVRAGWAAAEQAEAAGDAEAAAAARAAAERLEAEARAIEEAEMGIRVPRGRDAREVGYATGYVSDLVGMPGRSTNSTRVRDLLVWDMEADEDGAELPAGPRAEAGAPEPAPSAAADDLAAAPQHGGRVSAPGGAPRPGPAGAPLAAVPFQAADLAEWNPRSYRFLPPAWTRAIPPAGMPSARSEPASEALLMFQ